MSHRVFHPTLYSDVRVFLSLLLSKVQTTLGDQFVGLYLGGSLALGDFDPHWSDIDFVVVTFDELPPETIGMLEEMHAHLWDTGSKWAMKLDGSYIPQQVLRSWDSDHEPCPFVEEGKFYITNQGSALIQRHILREHGVVIAGPHPHTLIDPVDSGELRRSIKDMLEKWWRPLLDDADWLQRIEKQPFAVLTMCRALYTSEHGTVVSKPVAARWTQEILGKQWAALIEGALQHDMETDNLDPILRLIRQVLNKC